MAGLIEFHTVTDIYCSGFHRIEDVGNGNVRLYLYVNKEADRYLAASIVMPLSCVPDGIIMQIQALDRAGSEAAKLFPVVELSPKH